MKASASRKASASFFASLSPDLRAASQRGWGEGLGRRLWHRPRAFAYLLEGLSLAAFNRVRAGLEARLETMCTDPRERASRRGSLRRALR